MASTTISSAEGLQQNNYLTIALFTVIAYDYVLTLPREIDYIWYKRWTLVSSLFLLVRYCGLYILITFTLMWSSFLPGPIKVSETLWIASIWAYVIWIAAADMVMILRAWAMYNRSKIILGVLLTFWIAEVVASTLTCIMYPKKLVVEITHVTNQAYCGVTSASVTWTKVSAIPEIINSAVICAVVVFQFVKRALEMYRVTKKWHFNRYMTLFAGQSVLYFLFVVFFNRTAILVASGQFQTEGWSSIILLPLEYVPAFALTPRFIMSVRMLHPIDSQESQSRQSRDTDPGSTVSGLHYYQSEHRSSTGMMFDIRRPDSDSEGTLRGAEIPMEEWRLTMDPESAGDGV